MDSPRDNSGGWRDDLSDVRELFHSEGHFQPWVKWTVLLLSVSSAVIVGGLLLSNSLRSEVTPSPVMSSLPPTVAPIPTASASPTATPTPPKLSSELLSIIPGAWQPTSVSGCKEAWVSSSEGVSSLLVVTRAQEAFKAAGFSSKSAYDGNSVSVEAAGNQEGITAGKVMATVDSMSICLS